MRRTLRHRASRSWRDGSARVGRAVLVATHDPRGGQERAALRAMTTVTAVGARPPYAEAMTARVTVRSAQGPTGQPRDQLLRAFTWGNKHVVLPMLQHRVVSAWLGSPVSRLLPHPDDDGAAQRAAAADAAELRDPRRAGLPALRVRRTCGLVPQPVADPRVSVALPGRVVEGTAEPVLDPAEAERAALAVARNCGFALLFEGVNPLTATDEQLRAQLAGRPVVRITAAEPVRPGRHDPGSPWWVVPRVLGVLAVVGAARSLRRP